MAPAVQTETSWLLPVGMLLLGYITKSVSDWLEFRRTRQREREAREEARRDQVSERRNNFQRQTLLELQEALMQLIRSTAAIDRYDLMVNQKSSPRDKIISGELDEQFRSINARVMVLTVRVADKTVRQLADEVRHSGHSLSLEKNEEQADKLSATILHSFELVNGRIGELLREIDRSESL